MVEYHWVDDDKIEKIYHLFKIDNQEYTGISCKFIHGALYHIYYKNKIIISERSLYDQCMDLLHENRQ